MTISFTLLVEPKSCQHGSRVALRRGKIHHYNDAEKVAYQNAIILESKHHAPSKPLDGPLFVRYRFFIKPKKRKGVCTNPHEAMPYDVKPDVVNLVKGTEDALTHAGFWKDDKQVVRLHVEKWFVMEEMLPPRIEVTITTL